MACVGIAAAGVIAGGGFPTGYPAGFGVTLF